MNLIDFKEEIRNLEQTASVIYETIEQYREFVSPETLNSLDRAIRSYLTCKDNWARAFLELQRAKGEMNDELAKMMGEIAFNPNVPIFGCDCDEDCER